MKRPTPKSRQKAKPRQSNFLNPDFEAINTSIQQALKGRKSPMATQLPMVIKKGSKKMSTTSSGGGSDWNGWANHRHNNGHHSGTTYYQGVKDCKHTGDEVVFEQDGKALYAASWTGINEYSGKWGLIIDLANNVKPPAPPTVWDRFIRPITTVKWGEGLELLVVKEAPKELKSDLLSLNWPDMGIAPVGLDFWLTLWDKLPSKTVVLCQGGHGRTGTALASFMIAIGGMDWNEAIEEVRTKHCKNAVESLSQEQYLHALYVQRLKTDLSLTVDAAELADIQADLEWALAHRPEAFTTKGSKETSLASGVNGTAALGGGNYKSMGSVVATKMVGGMTLEQRCVDQKCALMECKIQSHLSWIPKDDIGVAGIDGMENDAWGGI